MVISRLQYEMLEKYLLKTLHNMFFSILLCPKILAWSAVLYQNIIKLLVVFREIAIVENLRLVRLLNFRADFGVKTDAKLTPILKLRDKSRYSKLSVHINPDSNFCVNILTFILLYTIYHHTTIDSIS